MGIRLRNDIDKLKKRVAALAALVEERFRMAIRALEVNDPWMAEQVIAGDLIIDREEVDVEEECLKILALRHLPEATGHRRTRGYRPARRSLVHGCLCTFGLFFRSA